MKIWNLRDVGKCVESENWVIWKNVDLMKKMACGKLCKK
jgi:hypothetical protein